VHLKVEVRRVIELSSVKLTAYYFGRGLLGEWVDGSDQELFGSVNGT
jgi:hypothetical protein